MNAGTIFRFQLGHREAIETVARSRASFLTGILLVLITTIPRNYDQTLITENPFKWIFGSLLFSLLSGTWVFIIAYQAGTWRKGMEKKERESSSWRCFMGMFWMTAPIAWLYALPVERWFDPVSAAKANVTLLAIVSIWRVWLITRCLSVTCGIPFFKILMWVLVTASAEIVLVSIFGGAALKSVMAGMSGMRNSPAEEVLSQALWIAISGALWTFPIALLVGLIWGLRGPAHALPEANPEAVKFRPLAVMAAVWITAAIYPQMEMSLIARYERHLREGENRAALDWLNRHPQSSFAPSRPLSPKPFEYEVFGKLPGLLGEVQESDATWVKELFIKKLDKPYHIIGRVGAMRNNGKNRA